MNYTLIERGKTPGLGQAGWNDYGTALSQSEQASPRSVAAGGISRSSASFSDLKVTHRVFEEAIRAMGQMIEVRDLYTAGHQSRVALISMEIASRLGLSEFDIKGIQLAALIHDLGKQAIPGEILSKPGRLNKIEFDLIKTHPLVGYEIVKDIGFPWPIADTIRQHHERLNGSGYPCGLKGDAISLEARIIAVADVVEAMSSNRPYRPSLGIGPALEEITRNSDFVYDGQVVEAFLQGYRESCFDFITQVAA